MFHQMPLDLKPLPIYQLNGYFTLSNTPIESFFMIIFSKVNPWFQQLPSCFLVLSLLQQESENAPIFKNCAGSVNTCTVG